MAGAGSSIQVARTTLEEAAMDFRYVGGPGTTWTVVLRTEDGLPDHRVCIGPNYICFHHGSWHPRNPEKALEAAIDILTEDYRNRLHQSLVGVEIEKGALG